MKEKVEFTAKIEDCKRMSTKELALETIRNLPETASWEEIEERIHFHAAIERGRADVQNGEITPHSEVKKHLSEWITS